MARYEVGYDGLDALLKGLPENTAAEPYEIELTEVTAEFLRGSSPAQQGTLQYILLYNISKYVSLSFSNDCDSILGALTEAHFLFYACSSLTSVDVSGMVNVTDASDMFYNCSLLSSVDVSGMTAVTNANGMFYNCSSLSSVDVSGMTAVTNANGMFYNCSSLTSVDVSSMVNVTDAGGMFNNCSSLTSVDVSSMVNVTNASGMFGNCGTLTSVDVSSMVNVTNASGMFGYCSSLEEIHGWEIPLTADMTGCFRNCSSLRTIYVPKRIPEESASWHVWDIRKDTANSRSTVRIYSEDGSYVSANVPSGDSWSMEIPGKTDELYFSAGSSITQEHMQKMLATRVPVTSKSGVLDPARDNFVLMAKDPDSVKTNITKAVFDTVHPIGSTYIQFPGCPSPNELWGSMSVWTELNFNGAFFRASGTNASAFGSGEQGDLVKNHTHNMNHIHDRGNMEISGAITGFYGGGSFGGSNVFYKGANVWSTRIGSGGSTLYQSDVDMYASRNWSGYTGGVRNPDWDNAFPISDTAGNDPNGIENRPRNYTVRIWKRTA